MDCIFCEISSGKLPAYKIYEDEDLLVILDKKPVSKGHLLVIPREHYEGIQDTPPNVLAKTWLAASALAKIYRINLNALGVNVLTNSGEAAGQVIFHFHVHVIPRWDLENYRKHSRHDLDDNEAKEVIDMVRPYAELYIKNYISQVNNLVKNKFV
ncbi:MAG: HIT family protein [Caldisphaera sp.]|nr:MAG: HIT family hydrolase [Caldisphaera sp.]PMP89480.1 MAG: HIT family hydrolase [Caldisphaera sp.]